MGLAQPRPVPAPGDRARARGVRGTASASFEDPGWDPEFARWGNPYCCAPPIARLPGRPARGDAHERADRRSRRHQPAVHHVQGARLHRARVRHGLRVDGADARVGRRGRSGGWPDFLDDRFPGRHVADRDGRPRAVPACPTRPAVCGSDPIQLESDHRAPLRRRAGEAVPERLPERGVPRRRGAPRRGRRRGRRGRRPARRDRIARRSAPTSRPTRSSRTGSSSRVFSAVFGTPYLAELGDTVRFGPGIYTGVEVDPGVPPPPV